MTAATLARPAATVSAQDALRILEQAWAYFTPPAYVHSKPPRERHDAVELFAYYRPAL